LTQTKHIRELSALRDTMLKAGDNDGASSMSGILYELGILAGLRFQLEQLGNLVLEIDTTSQDSHPDGIGALAHAKRLIQGQKIELDALRVENIELRNCDEP